MSRPPGSPGSFDGDPAMKIRPLASALLLTFATVLVIADIADIAGIAGIAAAAPPPIPGAATPAPASTKPITIHVGRLLDGRGGSIEDATVTVIGTKIAAVERGSGKTAPDYDLRGLTLMPGGIDTHVHIGWHFDLNGRTHDDEKPGEAPDQTLLFAVENAVQTVRGGITTVQSLGSPDDKDLRDWIARGVIPGPRVLTSLEPLSDPETTPDKFREQVRKLAADGADVIKVFASKSIREGGGPTLSQEQMDAICGEAKAQHLRVAVHAHGVESARRAILAGCTSIEHGVLLDADTLRLMAEHGTWFDPNIDLVFRNYFENEERFLGVGNYTAEGFAQMHQAVPKALAIFKQALVTPGLKVVFGTDAVAGSHGRNFQELVYRVEKGGQDPMAAIVSATSLAAQCLGIQDQVGAVVPGLQADLIALDGDPLRDIHALERVVWVMKAGQVVRNDARVWR
jgi:imidazolonepropionase-like amidohydrolase